VPLDHARDLHRGPIAADNGATLHQLMAMFDWTTPSQALHTRSGSEAASRRHGALDCARKYPAESASVPRRRITLKILENFAGWQEWRDSNPQPPVLEFVIGGVAA
jgi:hypothetical protein